MLAESPVCLLTLCSWLDFIVNIKGKKKKEQKSSFINVTYSIDTVVSRNLVLQFDASFYQILAGCYRVNVFVAD